MEKIVLSMLLGIFLCVTSCSVPSVPVILTAVPTATMTAVSLPTIDSAAIISVPGGTFTQTDGSESFLHTISSFKIGKYEVTYDLWYTVYQWAIANGFTFANAGMEGSNGIIGAAPTAAKYKPVTSVNWRDSIVWCNALSLKSGLYPVYCSDAGLTTAIKVSNNGSFVDTASGSVDFPYVNWSANGYRLPTEGEWQYAASYKDGISWTPYNYISGAAADYYDATASGITCWYFDNSYTVPSSPVAHEVGGKNANALGIHDMSGNVDEWCWDWYDYFYPATITDYKGAAGSTPYNRVLRGGRYDESLEGLQIGQRDGDVLTGKTYTNGFRFAKSH